MSIYYASLAEFAVLKIENEDSTNFLQGQLSQDINAVQGNKALLASYSNPKGRVFATLLLWQDVSIKSTYYALVAADNATFLQKRLSMFILRSKVKITQLNPSITGIWSTDTQALQAHFDAFTPIWQTATTTDNKPQFTVAAVDNQYLIRYPSADNMTRVLSINFDKNTIAVDGFNLSDSRGWQQQDIVAAIPWIGERTREVFVAQSINQDAIGAINFKKGCYPGQEVIARSHYLGNLKRRTIIATLNHAIENAQTLLASDVMDGDNPIGQVVNAVILDSKTYLLIEVQLRSIEDGANIYLANVPDVILHTQNVPYSLDKPE